MEGRDEDVGGEIERIAERMLGDVMLLEIC
jgi:hypothetical protein